MVAGEGTQAALRLQGRPGAHRRARPPPLAARNQVPKVHAYSDHVFLVLHAPRAGRAGLIEFCRTRANTKMTIAAERLAVIAAVTLPTTAFSSVHNMSLIVHDRPRRPSWPWSWASWRPCP